MAPAQRGRQTTVGRISDEVLAFTTGRDLELDPRLAEVDCIGTAAHVAMLSRMPVRPPIFKPVEARRVIRVLGEILLQARRKGFVIALEDQDVHLAVERLLTARLGDLGKKVHTGRSRNDQVATDLRLFAKIELLDTMDETLELAEALLACAKTHAWVPMVGRTHLQPAMPSSVGLWASAQAESLLDDVIHLIDIYELNDQCPLGAAASYGVPLPIDRELTSQLLGFSRPIHNVLYAINVRGKLETAILGALGQVMLSLARLSQDLILYSLPEFGCFSFPPEYGTGSSIMPQKNNPDVLELVRARSATVLSLQMNVAEIARSLPSGYNRDLQETKGPLFDGLAITRSSVRIMTLLTRGLTVHPERLKAGFTPGVFATDRALELVASGMPFRAAYQQVKDRLNELETSDPAAAVAAKTHLGAPAGLDWEGYADRLQAGRDFVRAERLEFHGAISQLMGLRYPPEN